LDSKAAKVTGENSKGVEVSQPDITAERQVSEPVPARLSWSRTFAAFKYRNYRLWFIGQLASMVGTWMQSTAQGYLVYQLTRSPAYLGYVGFAGGIPSWLLMIYGGVISDRMSRRTLLVITQTTMMLLAFVLAVLAFTNVVQPWHIIVMALLLGVANAFDAPARQAFVLEMVEREDLVNAIALNSSMFNLATAVGPAVAGAVYAIVGPAWCFTINGVSFLAVIVALLMMQIKPLPVREKASSAIQDLKEGFRYVAKHQVIRVLMIVAIGYGLFAMGYATIVPAWAVSILGGDASTVGLLQSARGLGSLVAALMIASLGRFNWKGKMLTIGALLFPILLLVFSTITWTPLSLLVMIGVGLGQMLLWNMLNTLIQTLVSDDLRGRVMGWYSLTFFGAMPVGALLAGGMADVVGEPATVVFTALVTLAFAIVLFWRMPQIRTLE
jgi:MFS family permease